MVNFAIGVLIASPFSWVRMELRFAFLVHIRRDRYILNAKNKKKFQGGFDYLLPMACNWSFRQFGDVISSQYPWGLHLSQSHVRRTPWERKLQMITFFEIANNFL